ncbi:hypothetical protein PG997_013559 [Apiospora hydei]|uniref:B box-type domain-containing protein n=1 Tax=Apiospora hydei TaxID=1337664 RepID=A0ABR1V6I2_9PEZI
MESQYPIECCDIPMPEGLIMAMIDDDLEAQLTGDGCDHIQCNCGADFCYSCGNQMENCSCHITGLDLNPMAPLQADMLPPVGEEASDVAFLRPRPYDHGTQRRAAFPPAHLRGPPAHLQEQNQVCQHPHWDLVAGPDYCVRCGIFEAFLYRCTECHAHVCARCRRRERHR